MKSKLGVAYSAMNTDKRILSITAFALLLCGIIAPFGSGDVAVIFAIVATLLALVFGFLGRSFLLGKVAVVGALIVFVIGTVNYVRYDSLSRADSARAQRAAEMLMRMEEESRQANEQ